MSTWKAMFTFKWTRCESKLGHRKFNFTNQAETKWFLRDKISVVSSLNFIGSFTALVVLIVTEKFGIKSSIPDSHMQS